MAKTESDVLEEWARRGYGGGDGPDAALSYIRQAKDVILAYCNIPQGAPMPEGLFYAWVELSHQQKQAGAVASSGTPGAIESIREGDTTVQFASAQSTAAGLDGFLPLLNRYRRLP